MYNPLSQLLSNSPNRRGPSVKTHTDPLPQLPWQVAARFHRERDDHERDVLLRLQGDIGVALGPTEDDTWSPTSLSSTARYPSRGRRSKYAIPGKRRPDGRSEGQQEDLSAEGFDKKTDFKSCSKRAAQPRPSDGFFPAVLPVPCEHRSSSSAAPPPQPTLSVYKDDSATDTAVHEDGPAPSASIACHRLSTELTAEHSLPRRSAMVNQEDLDTMMEKEALRRTMDPHLVIIGAERAIMDSALAAARADARHEQAIYEKAVRKVTQGGSTIEEGKVALCNRDKGHRAALLSFIPRIMERAIDHGLVSLDQWKVLLESPVKSWYNPILSRFPSAVVFADASGFTNLTETLAKLPNGAEQIGKTLNDFFAPLIGIVIKHGGDVIKFSGDALTIIWPAAEPCKEAEIGGGKHDYNPFSAGFEDLLRSPRTAGLGFPKRASQVAAEEDGMHAMQAAANCCLEIQEKIPQFGKTPVPDCNLTMHIGVGFDEVALLQVGGLLGRWEFCLAGMALDQISIAEPLAASGETVFSPQAVRLAKDRFDFSPVEAPPQTPVGFQRLIGRRAATPHIISRLPFWPDGTTSPKASNKLIKRFIPTSVGICLASTFDASEVAYPEEMRRISVIFLSIKGLNPASECEREALSGGSPGISGGRMSQLLMRLFQRSVYALEGSVNKFLVDDKGVLLLIVFGLPPLIHLADDPIRAVLCAMRLTDTLADEGLEGHVGVATGMCWCGVVGGDARREYTVLGDVVNLSARLMGKACVNGVLVDERTQELSKNVLEFEDGGELSLKGKLVPVRAFHFLGLRRGLQDEAFAVNDSPLFTWQEWPVKEQLRTICDKTTHSSAVFFINGAGGCGKTELAEDMVCTLRERNWHVFRGQNLDPTGIFSVPRLPLQEAFRELIQNASKDPFWRSRAQEEIRMSLGGKLGQYYGPPDPELRRKNPAAQALTKDVARHVELYWMLVSMMKAASGELSNPKLQAWAPLLSMVVTDLAFGPGLVAAMSERDEQHAMHNRFAEVCTAVIDGYTRHLPKGVGCMFLLHIRRSNAFFQSRDEKECAAVRLIAQLCLDRRKNATGSESSPLVLCMVSRESVLQDGSIAMMAGKCGTLVTAADFSLEETTRFLKHFLVPPPPEEMTSYRQMQEDRLTRYIFDVTGGAPKGVPVVLRDLSERGYITKLPGQEQYYFDSNTIISTAANIPLPQLLVGMAFSNFETLNPEAQKVLKIASTFGPDGFTLRELSGTMQHLETSALENVCETLSEPRARTFRKIKMVGDSDAYRYQFYSIVLRHVATTLVLETQRNEIRRLTTMGVGLNDCQMDKLKKDFQAMRSQTSGTCFDEDDEDSE